MIIGIGCDLAETRRIAAALERPGFAERIFTKEELALAEDAHRVEHLAARFAAKEAFLKALGTGLREGRLTEIGVTKDSLGKPELTVTGRFAELAAERGVRRFHVTLSHTKDTALAVVVLEGE
ncbi:MAG: holo-ACP synthase [Succiniclasticum sp.]|jgi:holo-[acyl-carrier protein] synthase|nr:holo-ACP synthase [Succiniclasticum sp.]MEE3478945.1 holo-ACP synthase [Succiniclasticum sp.]